ncbi:Metallo-dependent phosphatase-like protein [Gautieria morchelliformis]|nr:Metallo-dependent phosphatase-like protein [Gautieria morchelliformis]
MPRSRSGSISAPVHHRTRANSQSHIESAISAIQQRGENTVASGAFIPGTGGFVGGPPVTHAADHGTVAVTAPGTRAARRASVRHRKDLAHYTLNGKRVRTTERICNEVPPPATYRPSEPQFWSYADPNSPRPSLSFLKDHFHSEGRLTEEQALYILNATTLILEREPNLVKVGDGVTVCGDVHGQYYDLLKLFDIGGDPSETPYLFLGDYVDRGAFGIECLLYLYALKLHYPTTFFLLRGNHECRHLTEFFTFKKECLHKYSHTVYDACIRSFHALPLAALLDGRFLCVHGGIGPDMWTLADLNKVDRFQEPGMEGILCDILWADPIANYSRIPETGEAPMPRARRQSYRKGKGKDKGNGRQDRDNSDGEGELLPPGFMHNNVRGCSYFYTYTAVCEFLRRNGLLSVIRGHEAQDAGYSMYRKTDQDFPSLITIFSAPNYLDAYNNKAAVIKYIGQNITIRQFNATTHPYSLPGFSDAFTWSLPFVGSKIAEMLLAILNCCTREELEESTDEESEEGVGMEGNDDERMQQREAIKNKVLAVGRMARVFDLLREEAEGVSELTLETPREEAHGFRQTKLGIQGHRIRKAIHNFDDARKSDILNEHIPLARPSSPLQPRTPGSAAPSDRTSGPYTNPSRSSATTAYTHTADSSISSWEYSASSLVPRRRSATSDTATMIRKTLEGGQDDEEKEILELARRLSRPLTGREVRDAYGATGSSKASKEARRVKRMETA